MMEKRIKTRTRMRWPFRVPSAGLRWETPPHDIVWSQVDFDGK